MIQSDFIHFYHAIPDKNIKYKGYIEKVLNYLIVSSIQAVSWVKILCEHTQA